MKGEMWMVGCCGVYINVMFTLCCVKVDVWNMYWFSNEARVFSLGL